MSELDVLSSEDRGSGPAVVLIHGHPFDRSMWRPQLDVLDQKFRVIAPDLRGYGQSAAAGEIHTMAQLAEDVWGLLDHLGIERPHVVGLSMGGLVAMEMTIARPGLITSLGLIATTAEPVTDEERERRLRLADEVQRTGTAPLLRTMHPHLFGPEVSDETVRWFERMIATNNPKGAAAALRGRAQRPDYRPALHAFGGPAFVCTGTHDVWSTSAVTEQLAGCLTDPDVMLIPRVGHLPNVEAPQAFNTRLLAFLDVANPQPPT